MYEKEFTGALPGWMLRNGARAVFLQPEENQIKIRNTTDSAV